MYKIQVNTTYCGDTKIHISAIECETREEAENEIQKMIFESVVRTYNIIEE